VRIGDPLSAPTSGDMGIGQTSTATSGPSSQEPEHLRLRPALAAGSRPSQASQVLASGRP
jgi:hypothetical protein